VWGLVAWSVAYVLVLVCPHSSVLSMGESGLLLCCSVVCSWFLSLYSL